MKDLFTYKAIHRTAPGTPCLLNTEAIEENIVDIVNITCVVDVDTTISGVMVKHSGTY